MTDRAFFFLASLVMLVGSIGAAVWMVATGQLGTFDGNFLFLCALILAAAFALYLKYMISRAMEALAETKPVQKKTERRAEEAAEPVGKA